MDVDMTDSSDELQHYGVLGMKWGHRKAANSQQIHAARRRLDGMRTAHNVAEAQRRNTAKGSKERARLDKTIKKIESDFKKDPDRIIASRMTRGEKAAALILAGPFGLLPIAASSGVSRRIEQKHDTGAYKKS